MRQLISLGVLASNLCLQHPELLFAVRLQLCFVFLQLHQLIVQHLNLGFLSCQDVFMVALEAEVVHLGVTLVANTMQGVVSARKLTSLIAAGLAHSPAAALAILL